MSDMQIAMRLTLADFASGPLAEFMAKLEGIQTLAAKVTASFNGVSAGAARVGSAGADAAVGTNRLQVAVSGLAEGLQAVEAKLSGAADAFLNLGRSAINAGSAVEIGAAKIDAASASVSTLTGHVGGLNNALKGMAELWAGLKIEHGLRASVNAASDFATQVAQLRSLGLSGGAVKYAQQAAWRTAAQVPFASVSETLGARRAIIAGTGQNNERLINAALPQLLKDAYAYKNLLGSKMPINSIIQNFAGLAESRGMSQSAAGLTAAADQALQIAIATQGRMKLSSQEMVARQYKYNGAQLADAAGFARLMALGEQYTIAGHEGGSGGGGRGVSQVGTAAGMLLKMMLGGKMNKLTAELLQGMGMFHDVGGTLGTTTTSTNTTRTLIGTTLGEKDPLKWVHDVLVPRMLAYAIKNASIYFPHGGENSPEAQKLALERLAVQTFGPTGGVNVANMVGMAANPAVYSRLENTVGLARQAKTGDAAMAQLNPYQLAIKKFTAALDNLKIALATGILPILTPIIAGFAGIATAIAGLLHQVPALGTAFTVAGTALGAFLAISGFSKLVGSLKSVVGWVMRIGPASAGAAAESDAASASMAATWGARATAIGATVLRLGAIFAAVFGLGYAIRNIQLAGVTIQNYLERIMLAIAGGFDGLLTRMSLRLIRFVQSAAAITARVDNAVGLTSLGGMFASRAAALGAMADRMQASFNRRDQARASMFAYAGTPAGQSNDYMHQMMQELGLAPSSSGMRAAHGAPNTEASTQAAQAAAASILEPSMGSYGAAGSAMKHHARRSSATDWMSQAWKQAATNLRQSFAEYKRVKAEVERETGKSNPVDAIRAKYAGYAAVLSQWGQPGLAAQAIATGDKLANKAGYSQSTGELSKLQRQLAAEEKLIAVRKQTGSITQQQAEQQDIAAQKGIAPQMQKAAEAALKYAEALKDPALIASMEAQIEKIRAMGTQLTDLQKGITQSFQGGIQSFLEQLMRANMTWRNMLASLSNSILAGINQNIAKSLAQSITGSGQQSGLGQSFLGLFNPGGQQGAPGASSSSGGSLFGGLMSGIGSLFSGGSSAFGSAIFSLLGGSFATGSDYVPHDMVAQIHQGEGILTKGTNAKLTAALESGSIGGGNTLHLHVNALDTQSVMGALQGVAREASMLFGMTSANLNLAG